MNEAILAYYDAEMPTDKIPQMRFIADVTVGEGEAIPPNTRFIKTWRVENSGKSDLSNENRGGDLLFFNQVLNDGQIIVRYDLLMEIVCKIVMKSLSVRYYPVNKRIFP